MKRMLLLTQLLSTAKKARENIQFTQYQCIITRMNPILTGLFSLIGIFTLYKKPPNGLCKQPVYNDFLLHGFVKNFVNLLHFYCLKLAYHILFYSSFRYNRNNKLSLIIGDDSCLYVDRSKLLRFVLNVSGVSYFGKKAEEINSACDWRGRITLLRGSEFINQSARLC